LRPAEWLRDELRWDVLDKPRRVLDVLPSTLDEYLESFIPSSIFPEAPLDIFGGLMSR
jgi:hypothetical protein